MSKRLKCVFMSANSAEWEYLSYIASVSTSPTPQEVILAVILVA